MQNISRSTPTFAGWFCLLLLAALVQVPQSVHAQIVVFDTNLGNIEVNLFGMESETTVNNFLTYVDGEEYDGTIIHRSAVDFVIQGGGFLDDFSPIDTRPPITNEFGRSNLRGTIAMARTSMVDSATSQFFFNVSDDNTFLDFQNEGFTVFGEVTMGLDIIDAINDLQVRDGDGNTTNNNGQTFTDGIPVFDSANPNFANNLVVVNSVRRVVAVPEPGTAIALSMTTMGALLRRRRR